MTVMENKKQQTGFTLWFTGLSGAGKSTITDILHKRFKDAGLKVEVLDGDIVRTNLSKGLGFSKEDRDTNIRRIGFVANLLSRNGVIAITAAISPYKNIRQEVRDMHESGFVEIYAQCPLEIVEGRDVKGLYKKARSGEIPQFTGVSDPYEEPENPEITVKTDAGTPQERAEEIINWLKENKLIDRSV